MKRKTYVYGVHGHGRMVFSLFLDCATKYLLARIDHDKLESRNCLLISKMCYLYLASKCQ
jgi:hypothetical protein